MRLLLDTHVLLWWLSDDPSLSVTASQAIRQETDVFVSAASAWEIAIKRALGKLEAPEDLLGAIEANHFRPLSIELRHAVTAGELPKLHNDPFDRMLIAQARQEGLTLVTSDQRIASYGVSLLAAS